METNNANELIELLQKESIRHSVEKITMMQAIINKFGEAGRNCIIEAMSEKAKNDFSKLPIPNTERNIEKLIQIVWQPLKPAGMKYEVSKNNNGYQMKCTSCPIADLYKYLGAQDVGFALYCASDEKITEGFNNKIGLKRTKTIMQGDDCCDHFYYMKEHADLKTTL